MLVKSLESTLDSKEIKPVNPKGNQPWIFIGSTDAEAEAPIFWPPDVKRQLFEKYPNSMNMKVGNLQEIVRDQEVWCAAIHGFTELDIICSLNNNDSGSVEAMGFFFLPGLEFFLL